MSHLSDWSPLLLDLRKRTANAEAYAALHNWHEAWKEASIATDLAKALARWFDRKQEQIATAPLIPELESENEGPCTELRAPCSQPIVPVAD